MSNIHFVMMPTLPPVEAIARYAIEDYSLRVGPEGEIPVAMHRISIDAVTLSFRPNDHVLTGLDAYTNCQQWEYKRLALPGTDQETAVACIEQFDENGIGPSGLGPIHYIYDHAASLLLIRMNKGRSAVTVRCLSCGICELDTNGRLVELWVQGVVL